jgi:hypothetical protein
MRVLFILVVVIFSKLFSFSKLQFSTIAKELQTTVGRIKPRDYTFLAENHKVGNAPFHSPCSNFHRHVNREPVMLRKIVVMLGFEPPC